MTVEQAIPKTLYHYTSLAGLAAILKSGKIRCNRLDRVDDLTEGRSTDFPNLSQYIFVSCWSDSDEESIPLWHMYSAQMRGVRISLPGRFLREHLYESSPSSGFYVEPGVKCVILQKDLHGKDYFFWPTPSRYPLYKVNYSDFEADLRPRIVSREDSHLEVAVEKVGVYKQKAWSFQNEWRIKLVAFPAAAPGGSYSDKEYQTQMNPLPRLLQAQSISIQHYDVELQPDALVKMEITLGPKFDAGDQVLLESLLNLYAPTGVVVRSSLLSGTIR